MTKRTNGIDIAAFRAKLRDGTPHDGTVYRLNVSTPLVANDESRVIRFCFSDGTVDRAGDTIDPKGWDLSSS